MEKGRRIDGNISKKSHKRQVCWKCVLGGFEKYER
jgi:hypothetical protein